MIRALAAALALASAACGYHVAGRGAPLAGGVAHASVPPFENRTSDADAGALVAAAVREELGRRGAGAGEGGARVLGVVESAAAGPSSVIATGAQTWRLAVAASARLVDGDRTVAQARATREEEYLSGQDPLETEGRRRLALRRAAQALARDLVERLEAP